MIVKVAVYVAISPTVSVPCSELALEELKNGPKFIVNKSPSPSLRVSASARPLNVTFPLFSTVIVYVITSPRSVTPFALVSVTDATLVASIIGSGLITNSVISLVVLPSVSSPSSDVSLTLLLCPVLLAVTVTVLSTPPISTIA